MAFASSAKYKNFDFNDSNANKNVNIEEKAESNKQSLDFYESMYHFKKMFPRFESDVIEQILRSNNGSVDKTIDQLLTMTADYDSNAGEKKLSVDLSPCITQQTSSLTTTDSVFQDLPPSYNEFMSTIKHTENPIEGSIVTFGDTKENNSQSSCIQKIKREPLVDEVNTISLSEPTTLSTEKLGITGVSSISSDISYQQTASSYSVNRSRIMIGELSNDFLRIRLTTDQVKKLKTTIKKVKRDELTAIMNEKQPEEPDGKPLSLAMKEKLDMLEKQSKPDCELNNECAEDWQKSYTNVYKNYEKQRIQIIQDEYLAKIIQNEEFLNELKQNKDFMQTLDSDSGSNLKMSNMNYSQEFFSNEYNRIPGWESGENRKNYSISNAELQKKLAIMSKTTRAKFMKLATDFTRQARQKCNKTAGQMAVTCNNLFASQIKSIEHYNSNYNDLNSNDKSQGSSRYQKAYKSFKTSISKRNPKMIGNHGTDISDRYDSLSRNGNKPGIQLFNNDNGYDQFDNQKLPKIESFNMKFDSSAAQSSVTTSSNTPELDLFGNSYSYENKADGHKEYTYDYSVYPPVKILNNINFSNKG